MGIEKEIKEIRSSIKKNFHRDFMEHYHCNYQGMILRQAKKTSQQ